MNHFINLRSISRRRPGVGKSMAMGVAVTLLLAACGSDDKADTTATPSTGAPQSTGSGSPTTATPDTGATPSTTMATVNMARPGCDEVVVGIVLSSSGVYSQLGADTKAAADAFFKTHTQILGTPLKAQIENDNSDPTVAVSAAQRLANDPCVVAISGPGSAAAYNAAMSTLVAAKKPVIIAGLTAYPNFNNEPYIFSPNLTPLPMQTELFVQYFAKLGVKRPVVITGDDATGDAVEKLYSARNIKVDRVPNAVTDYEPKIAELKDDGYDAVVYVGANGVPAAQIALAKKVIGFNVPFFTAPSNLTGDFFKVAGDAAEGTRGMIWPAGLGAAGITNPQQRSAVEEIRTAVPADVDLALRPIIGMAWDNYLSLYLAMEEAQSTDPEAMQKVMDDQSFYGVNGQVIRKPVGSPGADHAGVQPESAQFAVVKNGKLVLAD